MKARVDLVLDCEDPASLSAFWREALDYREYFTDASVSILVPKEGVSPPLVLQGVPEPKAGKNRMHLDVHVDDLAAEVVRLEDLGAHRVDPDPIEGHGHAWFVMADPEGNEFCVVKRPGE